MASQFNSFVIVFQNFDLKIIYVEFIFQKNSTRCTFNRLEILVKNFANLYDKFAKSLRINLAKNLYIH